VPCTCEFGEGPSPGPGCRSVITLAIEKGKLGSVSLDGTKLGLVFGDKGTVFFIDSTASPQQKEALRSIASQISQASKLKPKAVLEARITQTVTPTEIHAGIEGSGSFDAAMILGADGKTPVIVENNGDVNVPRLEKGKTKTLKYGDSVGNAIDASGTNSSRGRFDWSDQTKAFF